MAITLERAKKLQYHEVLIHKKTGKRWYVNGKVRTWKRDENRIEIPVKHGLYAYDTVTADLLEEMDLERP